MAHTDNIRIEFNFVVDEFGEDFSVESMINKPIVSNKIVIGVITEAELDESGVFIHCQGVIWDKFIKHSFILREDKKIEFDSIVI